MDSTTSSIATTLGLEGILGVKRGNVLAGAEEGVGSERTKGEELTGLCGRDVGGGRMEVIGEMGLGGEG